MEIIIVPWRGFWLSWDCPAPLREDRARKSDPKVELSWCWNISFWERERERERERVNVRESGRERERGIEIEIERETHRIWEMERGEIEVEGCNKTLIKQQKMAFESKLQYDQVNRIATGYSMMKHHIQFKIDDKWDVFISLQKKVEHLKKDCKLFIPKGLAALLPVLRRL